METMDDGSNKSLLVRTALEYYEKEEAVAQTLTSNFIARESNILSKSYRKILHDHLQRNKPFTKNDIFRLQAIVVKLRGLNRRSNLRTKLKSDAVELKQKELEKKHMIFQNLEMEREHLQRSIDEIQDLRTTHIDLVSPEELMKSKNITKEKYEEMSEHEQQMALMSFELELRKEHVKNIETMKGFNSILENMAASNDPHSNQTASDFYEKEEALVRTLTDDKIINQFNDLFQSYRQIVAEHFKKKKYEEQ